MSERDQQIGLLREAFQRIQAKAMSIDINPRNSIQVRADARRIMEAADDAFEICISLLRLPDIDAAVLQAKNHNGHLGGRAE